MPNINTPKPNLAGYRYLPVNNPHLHRNLVAPNRNGTYKIQLAEGTFIVATGLTRINNLDYYKISKHLFFDEATGWNTTGNRQHQQTIASKTGVILTSNIEKLPEAPDEYQSPPTWTEPKKSFAVANTYQNCGGMCFAVSMARVKKAFSDALGINAISLDLRGQDYNISGTGTINRNTIPRAYFGYGVGGALACKGYADLTDNTNVWKGILQDGAMLQYWLGNDPAAITKENENLNGHSIIFKSYVFDTDGNITGFYYYDYNGINGLVNKATTNKVFFGGNLRDTKK